MSSRPSSTLGFGIIGVGMIADFHAQAIAHTRGGRLVGVATRNPENARAFAKKHHVEFATTSVIVPSVLKLLAGSRVPSLTLLLTPVVGSTSMWP